MKNPYEVLGLSQDVAEKDINSGFNQALMANMKSKQYLQSELMAARQQLLTPARRLAADFMYPSRPRAKRPRTLAWSTPTEEIVLHSFKSDAYDSLR